MSGLTASPLGPSQGFNWVYLVELLICGILSLFFLFYFNRLLAALLSYAVRAWTWHKYRAYIDITALQISPLGGRIFFKSVTYHAHNITVLVHDGNITWRYWLRRVQEAQVFDEISGKKAGGKTTEGSSKNDHAEGKQERHLPCRMLVKVSGVEAFIYNRSPLYDGIVEATVKKAEELVRGDNSKNERDVAEEAHAAEKNELEHNESHSFTSHGANDELPFWLRELPIQVYCKRAAAAIGNENTTSIITATVEQSTGRIDAGLARLDLYKLLFGFEFKKVVVAMKQNRDYKQTQASTAHDVLRKKTDSQHRHRQRKPSRWLAPLRSFMSLFSRRSTSSVRTASIKSGHGLSFDTLPEQVPGHTQWQGLSRYLTQDRADDHAEWRDVEYAKAITIADCEQVDMRFYWDISRSVEQSERRGLISDDVPPEYGIDLAVHGGTIVYGPWADRQRINLQQVFFPAPSVDATPLPPQRPDEPRLATIFKLYLSIEKDVTLRIPTREPSKDHQWENQAKAQHTELRQRSTKKRGDEKQKKRTIDTPGTRPYGWLDITVKPNTTVNYTMDMYARMTGYVNNIDLDVTGTEITTSVNHALLWRTGAITLLGDLSNPLSWNSLRQWPFKITCSDLEMFILRDHMFLIIDLVEDWGSGSSPEFYTFVPFQYNMDLSFENWKLYLNTNDANIINDPAEFDPNDFVTLEGESLDARLTIPLQHYRPLKNEITFNVLARNLSMHLLNSSRTTIRSLLDDKHVAKLRELTLDGTFCSNQQQAKGLTDVLRMDITASSFSLVAFGFLVRHLINVKENYFGDYLHFKTLEEFQNAGNSLQEAHKATTSLPKPQTGNELDVILAIVIKDVAVMLPTNLYSAPRFVKAEVPEASVDLRVTSYYLDLALDLSPVSIRLGAKDNTAIATPTQLFVSHTAVYGHRAFGLPPDEPAYVSSWDIDMGAINGELRDEFLHDVVLAAKALLFTFKDLENALPLDTPQEIYDISFVQVRTAALRVWLHAGNEALLLTADSITVHVNDWANEHFSQCVNVIVPDLTIACVDRQVAARHAHGQMHRHKAKTYGLLQTTIVLDVVGRKRKFAAEALKQQAFLKQHDVRAHRALFLQRFGPFWDTNAHQAPPTNFEPAAMPCPPMPAPLDSTDRAVQHPRSIQSMRYDHQSTSEDYALPRSSVSSSSNSTTPSADKYVSSQGQALYQATPGSRTQPGRLSTAPASFQSLSSMYAVPPFSLDVLDYDQAVAPQLPERIDRSSSACDDPNGYDEFSRAETSDGEEHTAVMIELVSGIRAYAEPKLADVVTHVMKVLQPVSVEEVIDNFQISIMSEVGDELQESHKEPSSLQIFVRLPVASIRISNPEPEGYLSDELDVAFQDLRFMARLRKAVDAQQDSMSLHSRLNAVHLTFTEGIQGPAAVAISMEDLVFWLASSMSTAVRAIVSNVSLEVAASSATYIAGLVERLVPLGTAAQDRFVRLTSMEQARLRLLLYQLTQFGEHVNDPSYLTMMTFVLRAYPDHYRNQESWKVLMRFRAILQSMPSTILHDLQSTFDGEEIACPDDAPQKMLESWTQWRNWDVVNVGRTTVFRKILGTAAHSGNDRLADARPLSITWVQERFRVAVTDVHNDSDIELTDLSFGFEVKPPSRPTGLMLVEENQRSMTMAHVHTSSVAVDLRWHLFEIAEKVLPRILAAIPSGSDTLQTDESKSSTVKNGMTHADLHMVVSADVGSVSLRTINLHHLAQAEGLKLSVVGTTKAEAQYGACISAILNADRAGTQLHSRTSMIWQSLLILPSVYADNLHYVPEAGQPPSASVAVAYKDLEFSVQEQLPGILGLVDALIGAEVVQIMRLVNDISGSTSSQDPVLQPVRSATSSGVKSTRFSLALLAGELVIEVALLRSLKYRLDGRAASVRIVPSMKIDQQLTVDIETGHISHSLVNISHGEEHRQQIVDVPPVNAHIVTHFSGHKQEITVQSTIGLLTIDAEALQSVMNTIIKPEVKNVIKVIGDGIDELQESVGELSPSLTTARNNIATDTVLQYHITLALAGIKIAASTPRGSSHTTAEFEIGIGECQAIVSNEASLKRKEALLFPELRGSLSDIGARLYVKDRGTTYPAGNLTFGINFELTVSNNDEERMTREFLLQSSKFEVQVFPETAAIAVDIVNQLQDRLKKLDLSQEVEYLNALRTNRIEKRAPARRPSTVESAISVQDQWTSELLAMRIIVRLNKIEISWMVHSEHAARKDLPTEDLVLTLELIELTTYGGREGRLTVQDLQIQLVPRGSSKQDRTMISALLPEVVYSVAYWSHQKQNHLALKASGKPLDLRLDSRFIVPFNAVHRSIKYAIDKFQAGTAAWDAVPTSSGLPRSELFGRLHIASLVAEADFAGAEVLLRGTPQFDPNDTPSERVAAISDAQHGRDGQFAANRGVLQTTLRAPGIAFKLEYNSQGPAAVVKGEMMVASSSNMLLANVVPLVLEITKSVKEVLQKDDLATPSAGQPANLSQSVDNDADSRSLAPHMNDSFVSTDPSAIFGKTRVNLNLRIARQEFGLTCQPIAKVDAKAEMDDLYLTLSTIESDELGHFFAISASLTQLAVKVQHQYSREPTFGFEISSIVLSLMNSKHFSGVNGISAILKVDPMKMSINGKQLQDLLLFREIWLPPEIRSAASSAPSAPPVDGEDVLMQKYQTITAVGAFPWNVSVSFAELGIELDLGQSVGKSVFKMQSLWASSQKTSDSEQNLCIGLKEVSIVSQGRMSGHIIVSNFGVRTLIRWPDHEEMRRHTPHIQASIGFSRIRAKAAFDYQAFAFADIEGMEFLMYNVDDKHTRNDRLVTMLDCSKVYVFCTSTSPSQAFALYQAVDRLIIEKQSAFDQSLKDIEKHLRRKSVAVGSKIELPVVKAVSPTQQLLDLAPISLHTDVVVSLGNISVGAFPSTFFDSQILKFEANNLQARFGAGIERGKIRSGLGMTIGQLQVALAAVKKVPMPKSINEINVDEVIASAVDARGGVILRVPRVVASMSTWQVPDTNQIEYIFKSLFEGKVDVGWNLSRINFIRQMWTAQSRALAARLGKPLPESAVKITAAPDTTAGGSTSQEKITAEVKLPLSGYEYIALEPPIIETPQLRDMGEATPPLEWIGLHREKLPNVTHQIVIVSLLRVAKEVEDAYQRILGT